MITGAGVFPAVPALRAIAYRLPERDEASRDEGEPAMFAVVYRWRLREGKEQQFAEGWRRVTEAIHARCGSYGSRLHRADDGTWVAYARWPDAESRERCAVPDPEGVALMSGAIAERFPETRLQIVEDLLAEPPAP
ncbi:antibiotic biosynthesis monooxygenase family protein [Streptomyces lavendulae]|uniref:antibiotic biosynthesis monooxygenase family protein n=1 Tax=Streptomyces lavendulae TaxID=1914 RepID=UPI0036C5DCEB